MRWVRDNTGRFTQRPHFEPRELDVDSENIVGEFEGGGQESISRS